MCEQPLTSISLKHLWKHLDLYKSIENFKCHFKSKTFDSTDKVWKQTQPLINVLSLYPTKILLVSLFWQLGICLPLTQLCCLAALLICCCHPWKTGLWVAWSGLPPCGWQQVGAVAAGGWQSWQLCLSARLWANAMSSSMSPAFFTKNNS